MQCFFKETAKNNLFFNVFDGFSVKTCTGSKNAKQPNLEAPKPAQAQTNAKHAKPRCNVRGQGLIGLDFCIFCICLSLCRFWSLGCLKPAQAQKNAKNPNLEAPKPAQAQKMQKNAKPRCQRSELDWSGVLQFLHFFEPVQVLRLPGFFAFF